MRPHDVDKVVSVSFEVLLAALVMFNHWASYRIFKRLQVINNKWINL